MAERIISGIYLIRNTVNGKVYVGSSMNIESRWYFHKNDLRNGQHHSFLMQRAWNKHGEEAFQFEIIEEVDPEILLDREQHWMDKLKCADKRHGYNRSPSAGNTAGIKRTAETKKKISESKKGCAAWNKGKSTGKQSPELIEKRFAKLRGVKRDPAIGAKISATKKALGQKPTAEVLEASAAARRGKPSAMSGRAMSDEAKALLSSRLKGRAATFAGKTHSAESKEKMRQARLAYLASKKDFPTC